jgi:hypothetical protein
MTNNGYQKAYEIKDVTDDYFLSSLSGPPFSFRLVDFKAYKAVPFSKLYPKGHPFLPYLDRRMLTVAATLKLSEAKISQLELAEQYYFSLKETTPTKKTYIIYCDNENTYVFSDNELTSMTNLKKNEAMEGNPVLIFNEENVWYPLMERDDSQKDPTMADIVKKYATATQTPQLNKTEAEILRMLKAQPRLGSDDQLLMTKLAAAHSEGTGPGQAVYTEFKTCWEKLGIRVLGGRGFFRAFNKIANYLSPITAQLATLSDNLDGQARLQAISKEYLKYTASQFFGNKAFAWGHSWPCELVGNTVDETYRTLGSHCVWQATNFASVLDAIEIENYMIEQCPRRGDEPNFSGGRLHTTVYVPKYDLVLGNGVIESVVYNRQNTVLSYFSEKEPRTVIRFIGYKEKWAFPILDGYYGTLSPMESLDIFNVLKGAHNDNIEGMKTQLAGYHVVSFPELTEGLLVEEQRFNPAEVP